MMPTREWSSLTTHWQVNLEDSVPRQRAVVGIGQHHAASPNKLATLDLFRPGGRLVTPNYYVWRKEIWGIVPETRKAHTTSSATYDHSSITKEIANSAVGEPWPFDAETLATVARLDADIAAFYGIPFRHGLPGFWEHKNVYPWTGGRESYQTACAGPSFHIEARIAQAAAGGVTKEPEKAEQGDIMARYIWAPGRAGVLLKMDGSGPYYPGSIEEAQILSDLYAGVDVNDRQWDVARQAALNIQVNAGKKLEANQAKIDAAFAKLAARFDDIEDGLTPDVDEAALAAELAALGVIDAEALAEVFLNASAARLAD